MRKRRCREGHGGEKGFGKARKDITNAEGVRRRVQNLILMDPAFGQRHPVRVVESVTVAEALRYIPPVHGNAHALSETLNKVIKNWSQNRVFTKENVGTKNLQFCLPRRQSSVVGSRPWTMNHKCSSTRKSVQPC